MMRTPARTERRRRLRAVSLVASLTLAATIPFSGCSDLGDPVVPESDPVADLPELTSLVPIRTVVGDTITIAGPDFGPMASGRDVVFLSGRTREISTVLSWGTEEITVEVPEGAESGEILIEDAGEASNSLPFEVAPSLVSFERDVFPFLQSQGCESCHFGSSGNNGFSARSPAEILAGGISGPGAIPRRADESLIVMTVLGQAPKLPRMPLGGDPMPEEQIALLKDWIYQGMREN